MLTTRPPIEANHRDSARVENRGPSTTTIVPPSVAAIPCRRAAASTVAPAGRAVRVGERHVHRAGVVEGLRPPARPVDQLVGHHERAGAELGPQPADRAGREDLAYAQRPQRPQVRPVRDPVRREPVVAPVPGQERDPSPAHLGHGDRVGRGPVRACRHLVLRRAVEQGVQARSADHGDRRPWRLPWSRPLDRRRGRSPQDSSRCDLASCADLDRRPEVRKLSCEAWR